MLPESDPRHGTTRGYHAGCHEACCRAAMARYEKAGRLARLRGGRAVPALGAQRRLQALMRLGWSSHQIAVEAGLSHRNHVWRILHGQKGKPTKWIQRDTDKWVREVYERLSMQIPEGRYVTRTRNYAEKMGWPPPLAWNDPDDPNEQPADWRYRAANRSDQLREFAEMGAGITEVCRRLKVGRDALEKWCARNGMSDVYRRLAAREAISENQHMRDGAA